MKPRHITFQGYDIDADKVFSVDPVDSHSTGTSSCQWSYGFTVRFIGDSMAILLSPPSGYGYSGGPSREQYKAEAKKMRADFIKIIWPK